MGATKTPPAKKVAVKKVATTQTLRPEKETRTIKYSDKSPGQPALVPIFSELRQLLLRHDKGAINIMTDKPGQIHLYSNKSVELEGKKRDNLLFASAIVQKGYVGFYLMPIYSDVVLKKVIAPELLKCLKGKSCFHIKKLDNAMKEQIQHALTAGYDCYKKKGWV